MKVFIDLFAGLGGASQAFYDSPEWYVIRIDNNEALLEYTKGLCILDISDFEGTKQVIKQLLPRHVEKLVIWASPPCVEFSNAYNAPKGKATRAGEDFSPSLACILAALDLIDYFEPHHWIIENVKGAIEYFNEEIGHAYRQRIGQFFLWGNFPLIALKDSTHRSLTKPDRRWSPIRPNIKAKIPIEYSQAILTSIDNQTTLF